MGVHPRGNDAFAPLFQIPLFQKNSQTPSKMYFSHRLQILNFPPIFAFSFHFPIFRKHFHFPRTFANFPLISVKFAFFCLLYVFFVSPSTLTMMHLCITQCTYWTPLKLGLFVLMYL